jgi:hypothetical protein
MGNGKSSSISGELWVCRLSTTEETNGLISHLLEPTYLFIDDGHFRQHYFEGIREWFNGGGDIDFKKESLPGKPLSSNVSAARFAFFIAMGPAGSI